MKLFGFLEVFFFFFKALFPVETIRDGSTKTEKLLAAAVVKNKNQSVSFPVQSLTLITVHQAWTARGRSFLRDAVKYTI